MNDGEKNQEGSACFEYGVQALEALVEGETDEAFELFGQALSHLESVNGTEE